MKTVDQLLRFNGEGFRTFYFSKLSLHSKGFRAVIISGSKELNIATQTCALSGHMKVYFIAMHAIIFPATI